MDELLPIEYLKDEELQAELRETRVRESNHKKGAKDMRELHEIKEDQRKLRRAALVQILDEVLIQTPRPYSHILAAIAELNLMDGYHG